MPKKRWSASDERKYKHILKSCKVSQGRKKGASKMCKRVAAATVERDIGMRGLGGGLRSIPARGMGAQLLSVNLGGDWYPGDRRWGSGALYKTSRDGQRVAFVSDADDTQAPPRPGREVMLTLYRQTTPGADDLEEVTQGYFPDVKAADRELVKWGVSGLRGTPAQHARDAGLLMREASGADIRGDRRLQHELAVRASEESLWTGDPDLERKADRFLKASDGLRGLGCACDAPSGLGGRKRRKRKR